MKQAKQTYFETGSQGISLVMKAADRTLWGIRNQPFLDPVTKMPRKL